MSLALCGGVVSAGVMLPYLPVGAQAAFVSDVAPGDRVVIRYLVVGEGEPDRPPTQIVVEADQRVILPLSGPLSVRALTASALSDSVRARLEHFMRPATFSVTVERRVLIHGDVRAPGFYYIDQTIRLREALTLAGGPNDAARRRDVIIVRGQQRIMVRDWAVGADGLQPLTSGDELFVERASWVFRNVPFIISVLGVLGTVVIGLGSL